MVNVITEFRIIPRYKWVNSLKLLDAYVHAKLPSTLSYNFFAWLIDVCIVVESAGVMWISEVKQCWFTYVYPCLQFIVEQYSLYSEHSILVAISLRNWKSIIQALPRLTCCIWIKVSLRGISGTQSMGGSLVQNNELYWGLQVLWVIQYSLFFLSTVAREWETSLLFWNPISMS